MYKNTYTFLYRPTYIGIESHRHSDEQANNQTDRQLLYIEADSQTAGKQTVRETDLQIERQTCRRKDS
jgi:hypothetical protein